MAVYIPDVGEKEALKSFLQTQAIVLGLYVAQVVPDGSTVFASLTPMTAGGGRGYAEIPLAGDMVEGGPVADKWSMAMNASGQAQMTYSNAAQVWTFLAADVADAATVYGVFGYVRAVPFDNGSVLPKIGRILCGAAGAKGTITGVVVISGSWELGTAAGYIYIKDQTGTFVDNENLTLEGHITTVAVGSTPGANYANGDIFNILQANSTNKAKGVVTANSGGNVTGMVLVDASDGYTNANGLATSKITGGGNNALTANISCLASVVVAKSNTGTVNGGDSHKQLIFVEALTTPTAITQLGQTIGYTPVLTMSTL